MFSYPIDLCMSLIPVVYYQLLIVLFIWDNLILLYFIHVIDICSVRKCLLANEQKKTD